MLASLCFLAFLPWLLDGARVLHQGWSLARKPFVTCMTELVLLDGATRVAHREELFPTLDHLPLGLHVYNTANYLPAGLIGRWLALDGDQLLVVTRLPSFAAALGLLGVVAFYLRDSTRRLWPGLFAVGALLYFHSATLTDFFRNRPETPALFFSMLGWTLAARRGRRWPLAAGLCFAAAFAYKQSFLAAPLALALDLLRRRELRPLSVLSATTVAASGLVSLGSWALLGHGYWKHVFVSLSQHPTVLTRFREVFLPPLVFLHWRALAPVALVAIAFLLWRRLATALVLYGVVCGALAVFLSAKEGSDLNYFGELSVVMVLLVATALAEAAERHRGWAAALLLPLVGATWVLVQRQGLDWNQVCTNRIRPTPGCFRDTPPFGDVSAEVQRFRRAGDDALILVDEIAVRSGHSVVFDWFTSDLAFRSGLLNFQLLRDAVQARSYQRIVFGHDSVGANPWTTTLRRDAVAAGYVLRSRNAQTAVFSYGSD